MANTGFKGIDVRQTGNQLVFRAFLQTSAGALLGTGTTVLSLVELQSDGTIKSYDFNDNTLKTTALTTPTLAMTHRPANNGATTTGYWTAALSTLTGLTVGSIYSVIVNNSGAFPTDQMREFQYGSAEGDLVVTAGTTGLAYLQDDVVDWKGATAPANTGDAFARLGVAGVGLTNLGDTRIANLDTTVSSRTKPADTQARVTLADTVTTYTGNTPQTGDNFARIGVAGAGLTALGDARIANLDTTVSSRSTFAGGAVASVTGAVGSVTGNVGGNVTGSVGSVSGAVGSVTGAVGSVTGAVSTNPNAVENAIKAKTDNLPVSPAAIGSVMNLDLTQAIPTSNTAQTIGDALNAARAQGFGRWKLVGNTLSLYAADGLTVVKTLTFDDTVNPGERK